MKNGLDQTNGPAHGAASKRHQSHSRRSQRPPTEDWRIQQRDRQRSEADYTFENVPHDARALAHNHFYFRLLCGLLGFVVLAGVVSGQQPGTHRQPTIGQILVATEKSRDPDLARSVILLIYSDPNGLMGLILNRPQEKAGYLADRSRWAHARCFDPAPNQRTLSESLTRSTWFRRKRQIRKSQPRVCMRDTRDGPCGN
jgi:hypothetical protein